MKLVPDSVVNAAKKIKYLFLDVDGVLTDGKYISVIVAKN